MARRTDRHLFASVPAEAMAAGSEVTPSYPELLGRLPAIVYVADAGGTGRWHYVSPQIEAILGFSPEQWCRDPMLWAARLHPDDRRRVLQHESGDATETHRRGAREYRLLHRDGHVVWIRDDAALVLDADGARRWHGVLSDVTEQKHAEEELERRAVQHAAVARFGEHALEGARASELMQEAVACAATGLEVDFAAVHEQMAVEGVPLLRAGCGHSPSSIGAEATVPIQGRGAQFGVLGVQSTAKREFTSSDVEFLQALANVLADALERQATEDQIRHRALHDSLTELPNRVLFLDRLEHALARLGRHRSIAAVLFLDLDGFKLINDNLGHQAGDELLAAAASRLRQAVRASDTVARFGGDEFAILLEDISDEHDAIEMAERVAAVFTRPFVLERGEQFVTTSIGISLARGGELADELIRDADAAMYRAKERGSARYELFDQAMRDRAIVRLRIENDLRRAITRDQLRLDYQPVVSLYDRSIVGVEALLRWQHPERGLVAPGEFIPVAEEDGLIEPIGRWVLEQACRQAAQWHRTRPSAPPVRVSVNLSGGQFVKKSLPETVAEILRATGLRAPYLSLEITEGVILQNVEALTEALHELKQIGVKLVLDDFGTGYSSLAYLTRLPLDALKVDRSFVDGLGIKERDTAITEAIVAMSRALSLDVIGEGVETALQASELARLGCGMAQGFYYSPAVPATEITRILEQGPPWLMDKPKSPA